MPAATSSGDLAQRLRGVGVEQRAGLARDARRGRAMSWITPVSLFTAMTLTSSVGTASAAGSTRRVQQPVGPTGRMHRLEPFGAEGRPRSPARIYARSRR